MGREPAGSPTTSKSRSDGIRYLQYGCDPGLRDPERYIVLPWTVDCPDDAGFVFGDNFGRHVCLCSAIGDDWIFFELIVSRSYYGGLVKAKRPETWPLFFQVDCASPILRFAWRPEGGF